MQLEQQLKAAKQGKFISWFPAFGQSVLCATRFAQWVPTECETVALACEQHPSRESSSFATRLRLLSTALVPEEAVARDGLTQDRLARDGLARDGLAE